MKENFDNKVANGVATEKKKYASPEIEVINLDEQPRLLAGSTGAGFSGVTRGSWDEDDE